MKTFSLLSSRKCERDTFNDFPFRKLFGWRHTSQCEGERKTNEKNRDFHFDDEIFTPPNFRIAFECLKVDLSAVNVFWRWKLIFALKLSDFTNGTDENSFPLISSSIPMQSARNWRGELQKYVNSFIRKNFFSLSLFLASSILHHELFSYLFCPATVAGVFGISCLVKAQVSSALNSVRWKNKFSESFSLFSPLRSFLSIYWSWIIFCCWLLLRGSSCVRPSMRIKKKKPKSVKKFPRFSYYFFSEKTFPNLMANFASRHCH